LRKLLIVLLGLIAIFVAAVLVMPSFIDWNEYKGTIASQATKMTGRDVSIGGDLRLSVFPIPVLSVQDLHLTSVEGATEADMVSIKALTMRVALWPLFAGEVKIESISLVEPVIHLEVLENGLNNWTFAAFETFSGREMDPTILAIENKAEEPVERRETPSESDLGAGSGDEPGKPDMMVMLDHFAIRNGTLTYRDAGSRTFEKITGFNANIAARSLKGPFEAEGDMVVRHLPVSFSAKIGPLNSTHPFPLTLEVGLDPAKISARISGSLSKFSADGKFTGTLKIDGDDLGKAIAFSAPGAISALPGFLTQEVTMNGALTASAKDVAVNDLFLQFGDIKASGTVAAALSPSLRTDATLRFSRVDLDKWLAMPGRKAKAALDWKVAQDRSRGDKPAVVSEKKEGKDKQAPLGFSLPSGFAASLNLSTEVLVYNGKVIREVVMNTVLEKGRLSVSKATAQLPGSTSYALSGTLTASKGRPVFAGSFKAASKNLRALLDWLEVDIDGVPADRLRGLSLSGQVTGSRQQVNVTSLVAQLDATKITGGLAIALRERPAFGLQLNLDRLNLNAYLPVDDEAGEGIGPAKGLKAEGKGRGDTGVGARAQKPTSLKVDSKRLPDALSALGGFDANFKIAAGTIDYNKIAIKGVRLDGTLQGGKLTLRNVGISNLAGAGIKVTGLVEKLRSAPEVSLDFDLKTKNLPEFFRLSGGEPPKFFSRMGKVTFAGRVKGSLSSLQLDAGLEMAGGKATLAGVVEDLILHPKMNMNVDMTHPSVIRLVRVFIPDYRPAAVKLGGVSFRGQMHADADRLILSNVNSQVGPVALAGEVQIVFSTARPHVKATLSGSEIIIDLFLPAASKSLGLAPGWRMYFIPAAAQHQQAAPTSTQAVPWSNAPLDLSALSAFDADIKLVAPALAYDKYRVDKPQLVMNLKDSVLTISQLSGKMFEGDFNMQSRLVAAETSTLSSRISVVNADIKRALFAAGDIDVADGNLQFTLNMATSGRSSLEMISALSGKGVMKVTEGVVEGFNLTAVSEKLKNLDNTLSFLSLLQTSMSGGKTRFSRLDGTFDIEKGVVRTNNILLLAQAGEGRASGVIDLPRWMLDIKTSFSLTEHSKAPPFGMHLSGSIDQPRRVFDVERLQAYLLQRGVGTLLRKVSPKKGGEGGTAGQILDKILGSEAGTKSNQGQTAPPPTKKQETINPLKEPEKVLKEILKGIFK